jgi:hypothetical protein
VDADPDTLATALYLKEALAERLAEAGRAAEAQRLRRFGIEPGGRPADPALS